MYLAGSDSRTLEKALQSYMEEEGLVDDEADMSHLLADSGYTLETDENVTFIDDDLIDLAHVFQALRRAGLQHEYRELEAGEVVEDDEIQVYNGLTLVWGAPLYTFLAFKKHASSAWWQHASKRLDVPCPSFGAWLKAPNREYEVIGDILFDRIIAWCEGIEGWEEANLEYCCVAPC